ncbi:MAG: glycosyltransferase family 39 protein [Proteobacteria bacterium]|nr:glycosyltransferase family 39 protein [Pseudomonadota bacterium]
MAIDLSETAGLTRSNLVAIFLAALVIRILNWISIDDPSLYAFAGDSPIYWDGAKAWLDSGYFSRAEGGGFVPETERVPLYHLFLVPFRWIFDDMLWPVLIAQSILDTGTCMLIGLLGAQLTRSTGLLAGLLAAAWPNLVIHSQLILSDSLFLFLFTGVLYFASKYLKSARLADAVVVGILCGGAIMTRSVALYIPISMAISAPFISRKILGNWHSGLFASIAILGAGLVVVSPLLLRNANNYDSFQLTAQGGTHLLNWVVGYVNSLEKGKTFTEEAQKIQERHRFQMQRNGLEVNISNPFEAAAMQVAFAKQEFRKIPIQSVLKAWLYGAALNLGTPAVIMDPRIRTYNRNSLMDSRGTSVMGRLWSFLEGNDPTYLTWVAIGLIASTFCVGLQFYGWIVLMRHTVWPALFGTLAIGYFLLVNGPVGTPKYRLPFEPILIVFQALALLTLFRRFQRKPASSLG